MSTAPPKSATSYARFIPREELGAFAAWQPGALSEDAPPAALSPTGAAAEAPATRRAAGGTGAAATATAAAAAAARPPLDDEQQRAALSTARQSGYQDGYRDGLVALDGFKQSYAAQLTTQFATLYERFEAELLALEAEMAGAVAQTAVKLARQVLRSELAADPARVARVAAEAVDSVLLSARRITVRLNPQDMALVAEGAAESLQARGARLQADPAVDRGGCVVDSDLGSIDARIAARWAQAAGALGSSETWRKHDDEPEEDA